MKSKIILIFLASLISSATEEFNLLVV